MRVSRRFLTALALLALLHIYIGSRLLPPLPLGTTGLVVGWLAVLASFLMMPLAVFARGGRDQEWSDRLAWIGLTTMGLFSSLFVFTLLRDMVLLIASAFATAPQMLAFTRLTAMATIAIAVLATLIGLFNARRRAAVVDVEVPVANLPAELRGFSIAQISDVHVGPTIKHEYVAAIVDAVNGLDADVIAVTGDVVDGNVPQLAAHVAPLSRLRSRHGTYFVTGNHEYYSGAQAWTKEFERLGMHVLTNQHVVLTHQEHQIVVAGVTDYSAHHFDPKHRSDPVVALRGAPASAAVRILLAHQPRSAEAAAEAGFDLQLSGHTHGGQFWPWNHFVRFQQPFTAGLNRLKNLWVYTSRGTGYWGPPKRFGAPSEITRIRLIPA
ncbi:MAG TPA: metallophosphoesterase [Steroidobacteraceae bacterium]|jgi:predicted MPP superfamily phosphohydrolase|nr:metallophosphoesterase [Steroidobacteraceae bacterium]